MEFINKVFMVPYVVLIRVQRPLFTTFFLLKKSLDFQQMISEPLCQLSSVVRCRLDKRYGAKLRSTSYKSLDT